MHLIKESGCDQVAPLSLEHRKGSGWRGAIKLVRRVWRRFCR